MPTAVDPRRNQYRCNACGRYFDTQAELDQHSLPCRASKMATESGRQQLEREDARPHEPNDKDKKHGSESEGPLGAP